MTLPLTPGAQIAAELRTGRAGRDRVTSVEFVGGPRCGAIETVAHAGAAPRTLHDDYHRTAAASPATAPCATSSGAGDDPP
jgi:hypothetical protein